MATREKIRSRFHGSHDLIHRLFVCISGARLGWGGVGRAPGVGQRPGGQGAGCRGCQVLPTLSGVFPPPLCHFFTPTQWGGRLKSSLGPQV